MRTFCSKFFAIFLLLTILTGVVAFADTEVIFEEETIHLEEAMPQEHCGLLSSGVEVSLPENLAEPISAYDTEQNLRLDAENLPSLEETLEKGCLNRDEFIDIRQFGVKLNDLKDIFYCFSMKHPELMIATSYQYVRGQTLLTSDYAWFIGPYYLCSKEELAQKQQEMDAFVDSYVAEAEQYTDSLEQVLAVHDKLVLGCAYCTEAAEKSGNGTLTKEDYIYFHAYGLFDKGTVVCQGYAQAFYAIMKKLGFEVNYCFNSGHIWNYIKLNGKWYHLDATWDDPTPDRAGVVSHGYFLKSDGAMTSHAPAEWKTDLNALPECNSTKYERGYLFNFRNQIKISKKDGKYQFDVATGPNSTITFTSDKLWTGDILATEPADGKIKFMFMKKPEKPSIFYAAQKDKNGVLRGFGSITLEKQETNTIYSCPLPPASDKVKSTEIYFRDGETQKPTGPVIVY